MAAANRDEAVFPNPDVFDVSRCGTIISRSAMASTSD
jgi:cytochrome P450